MREENGMSYVNYFKSAAVRADLTYVNSRGIIGFGVTNGPDSVVGSRRSWEA
jgi:hypothetical protein